MNQKIENKNDNEFYNDNTNNNKTITKKDNKNGVEKENGTINDNNDNNNNNDNNDNIGNNNDNVNDGEIIPLIKFNANNTSRNKQPNDSKYELDNYDFDFSIKYEKRSFTKLFKIIFINNDFNKAFFFKSSLYLKQIYRIKFFISINEEILFNTLLEDLKYNGNNKFLSILMNVFIIPLIAMIFCFIISFLFDNLTDYKDDLRDLFIEEEIKMLKDEKYKVKDDTKIEIKKNIFNKLKYLKIKIIILFIIDVLFWLFSIYYIVIYCNIFPNRILELLLQAFLSIIEAIPSNALISLLFTLTYKISLSIKSKYLYKLTLFFN